ncbi:MAG: hypothetical protein HC802_17850 [Caldilineaceae bacterium]|nr:hypothetical protein [Caldilineaceae bacterium]
MVEDDLLRAETAELLADIGWRWALHLVSDQTLDETTGSAADKAAELLVSVASNMESDGHSPVAEQLRLLAERYHTVPVRARPTQAEISTILEYAQRFLEQEETTPGESGGYPFIARWMDETFTALDQHIALFVRWMQVAQELAGRYGYPALDENLWDLENRIDYLVEHQRARAKGAIDPDIARFKAFVLAYTERHLEAAAAWEALDEPALAAEQARLAGDMEHAYQLLRRARLPIPEDLATTVKLIRLLDQLAQKHHDLGAAERAELLRRLDALRESVATAAKEDFDDFET